MNEEYIDNVKHLIEQKDADQVKELLADLHPADIAELCNDLNPEEAKFVYRLLNNETAADVLVEMDEDARKELLDMLPSETIAKRFVDYMDTDDAVDLMRELDEDKQEEILSHIEDIEQAGDIVDLLKYDENTAGGLMGTEMVLVNENWSMPECLKEMRQQACRCLAENIIIRFYILRKTGSQLIVTFRLFTDFVHDIVNGNLSDKPADTVDHGDSHQVILLDRLHHLVYRRIHVY